MERAQFLDRVKSCREGWQEKHKVLLPSVHQLHLHTGSLDGSILGHLHMPALKNHLWWQKKNQKSCVTSVIPHNCDTLEQCCPTGSLWAACGPWGVKLQPLQGLLAQMLEPPCWRSSRTQGVTLLLHAFAHCLIQDLWLSLATQTGSRKKSRQW